MSEADLRKFLQKVENLNNLVSSLKTLILIDCGSGVTQRLDKLNVPLSKILDCLIKIGNSISNKPSVFRQKKVSINKINIKKYWS